MKSEPVAQAVYGTPYLQFRLCVPTADAAHVRAADNLTDSIQPNSPLESDNCGEARRRRNSCLQHSVPLAKPISKSPISQGTPNYPRPHSGRATRRVRPAAILPVVTTLRHHTSTRTRSIQLAQNLRCLDLGSPLGSPESQISKGQVGSVRC
jgi:hypothetical protein